MVDDENEEKRKFHFVCVFFLPFQFLANSNFHSFNSPTMSSCWRFFFFASSAQRNSVGNLFFFHIVEILFGKLNFRLKSRRFKLVGPRQRKKYHPRTRANTILVLFRHRCVVLRSSLLASKHYVEKFFNFHFVVSSGKCVRLCGNCNFFC